MLYFFRLFKISVEYCHLQSNVKKNGNKPGRTGSFTLSLSYKTFTQLVTRHLEPYVVFVEVDLQLIRILVQ
jgi:hypothetical protein